MKNSILAAVLSVSSLFAGTALACGGDGSGHHIGKVTNVDASAMTFTINDMESQSPITFNATAEIIAAVQKASGHIQVSYEENDEGALKAVGINF